MELWGLGSLKGDLEFLFLVVLLVKMKKGKTLKSWVLGDHIDQEKEFRIEREREQHTGAMIFFCWFPHETQEDMVKKTVYES